MNGTDVVEVGPGRRARAGRRLAGRAVGVVGAVGERLGRSARARDRAAPRPSCSGRRCGSRARACRSCACRTRGSRRPEGPGHPRRAHDGQEPLRSAVEQRLTGGGRDVDRERRARSDPSTPRWCRASAREARPCRAGRRRRAASAIVEHAARRDREVDPRSGSSASRGCFIGDRSQRDSPSNVSASAAAESTSCPLPETVPRETSVRPFIPSCTPRSASETGPPARRAVMSPAATGRSASIESGVPVCGRPCFSLAKVSRTRSPWRPA